MSFWDRILPWRKRDTSTTVSPSGWFLDWARGGEPTLSGVAVSPDQAMKFAAVWSCVRVRSEDVAKTPCFLYRRAPNGGKVRAIDHPAFRLIQGQPNPRDTAFEFKQIMQTELDLRGNALAIKQYDSNAQLIALWPVCWRHVIVRATPDLQDLFYDVVVGTESFTFPAEGVLHLRGQTLNGLVGVSPIHFHRETIGLGMAAERYGAAFFGNSAQPRGAVKVPSVLSPDAAQALRADWESKYRGVENSNRLAIFDGGMEWVQIGMNNSDAEWIASRTMQNRAIWAIYRVPPHKVGDLERCMPADTLVYTEGGPKQIDSVRPGDMVWSPTARGPALRKVLNVWDNGMREIVSIRTTNRAVRCTGNHKLLVRRPFERPLNPGEIGGRNCGGEKRRVVWRDVYVAADEIKIGDTLVTLRSLPKEGCSVAPNGRALTVGFLEFCGLFLADGNIAYQEGKPARVQIARSSSASYMDAYREIIRSEFSRYAGGNGRGNMAAVALSPVTLTECERQTVFSSVVEARSLVDLGFSGTAFTKRVPSWLFECRDELRLAFLRGFLDGDGTVDGKGRITYYSANKALLDGVRHLCIGCGVPVTNLRFDDQISQPPGARFPLRTRMFRFTCSDPGANKRIGSHDTRYQERLAAGREFSKKDRAYPRFGGKSSTAPGLALARVNSIEHLAAEPVFDIEVEGEHCFFADCVASHNSTNNNIEHQAIEYVTDCLQSEFARWQDALNRSLLTTAEQGSLFFEFQTDGLLRGDMKSRFDAYALGRNWGFLSVNDIREKENMNRIPNGDIYLEPLNMVEAGQRPPAQLQAPPPSPPAQKTLDDLPPFITYLPPIHKVNGSRREDEGDRE